MEIQQLLFELSHPLRYQSMVTLNEGARRLSDLAEALGSNNPETSRHLDRLRTAKMVEKDPDGYYQASNLGRLVISLLPPLAMVARNDELFNSHDLSHLPSDFKMRLGALEPCELVEGTTVNILKMDKVSRDTQDRIFSITCEKVRVTEEDLEAMDGALAMNFDFKIILQESQLDDEYMMRVVDRCGDSKNKHFRIVDQIPLFVSIMDEQVMLAFLDQKGEIDFSACLWSSDPGTMQWADDICDHYWKMGKYVSEYHG